MNKSKISEDSCCNDCMFFDREIDEPDNTCPAYPNGIPERYLSGKSIHDTVQQDQVSKATLYHKVIEYPEL